MKNKQAKRMWSVGACILAAALFLTSCRVVVQGDDRGRGHHRRGWRGDRVNIQVPLKLNQVRA